MEERRSFWDYLKKIVGAIMVLAVAILVIIAIWGQPTTIELAYFKGVIIGTVVGFIMRSCLISNRRNK